MTRLLLLLCLLALPLPAAAQAYTVTDLGDISPVAINNVGQVVGQDALWTNGGILHLNGLNARAINNRGQVVGSRGGGVVSGMIEHNVHAFLWQNGTLRDLGTPRMPSQFYASGINDKGQIVGVSYRHPVLWENGRKTYLPKLIKDSLYVKASCETGGINNRGQCVGYADALAGETHAVLWESGRIVDLGTAPGHTCKAVAINDQGQVAGFGTTQGYNACHVFLWQRGRRYDLKTLPGDTDGEAAAINGRGQIVGTSRKTVVSPALRAFPAHAFLWQSGKMRSISALLPPRSGWRLETATGINDRGQIVGTGLYRGKERGYLLTPGL